MTPKSISTSEVFSNINSESPIKATHPNTYFWYQFINSFSNDLMKKWIEKAPKPAQKPVAKDDDDLFGDDDAAPVAPKPKPQPPAKKEKVKPVAKSIVVFDVKVEDIETDLDALAKKIFERTIEGLVWSKDVKKLDVAYGIQKLQVGCVIEDDKVATDDIFEPIEAWEEVQSVDMVSMQKLWSSVQFIFNSTF